MTDDVAGGPAAPLDGTDRQATRRSHQRHQEPGAQARPHHQVERDGARGLRRRHGRPAADRALLHLHQQII